MDQKFPLLLQPLQPLCLLQPPQLHGKHMFCTLFGQPHILSHSPLYTCQHISTFFNLQLSCPQHYPIHPSWDFRPQLHCKAWQTNHYMQQPRQQFTVISIKDPSPLQMPQSPHKYPPSASIISYPISATVSPKLSPKLHWHEQQPTSDDSISTITHLRIYSTEFFTNHWKSPHHVSQSKIDLCGSLTRKRN